MHANSGDIPPPVESAGLHCPHCDYDLTGLTEDRCPECGEAFDRELLRKIAANEPIPAVPWDTDQTLRGFFKTWWLALVNRGNLARDFPLVHDHGNVILYTFVSYLIAILIYVVSIVFTILASNGDIPINIVIGRMFGGLLWALLFETFAARGLAAAVPPRKIKNRDRFWLGLSYYTSGYTWLLAAWDAVSLPILQNSNHPAWSWISWITATMIFLWWASAYWIMAIRRSENILRILLACIWIVLAAIVAGGMTLVFIVSFDLLN